MTYKDYTFESGPATMTDPQYIELINVLEKSHPKRICELGAGQSTKIFEQYCDKNKAKLFTIEHDKTWARKDTVLFPLVEKTSIDINGNIYETCNKYDGLEDWLKTQNKFDFVSIDGPYGYGERKKYTYARIQVLSFILLNKLSDRAYIFYHDSERPNSKTTMKEIEKQLGNNKFHFTKTIIGKEPQLTIYKITRTLPVYKATYTNTWK